MRLFGMVASAALVMTLAVPVDASTFVAQTPQKLVQTTDSVVQGKIVNLETRWSESGRMVVTEALVLVDEVLIGKTKRVVKVRTYGGEIDGVQFEAIGFPKFEADEKVLLFLKADDEDGSVRVHGYQQGQFRVVTRNDGVTLVVPMVDDEAAYITKSGALLPVPESVEIGTFKRNLQTIAQKVGRTAGTVER